MRLCVVPLSFVSVYAQDPTALANTAFILDDPFHALVRREINGDSSARHPMSRPSTSRQNDPPYVTGARRLAMFDEMKYENPRRARP